MAPTRKCVVWDLDDTIWDGVCLEGEVRLRPGILHVIQELDRRGVLHSVASRGVEEVAMGVLRTYGLEHFFLAPRINWLPKPLNVAAIAKDLGLARDAIAFIDDDAFEREQVVYMLPDVLTLDARMAADLPTLPEFTPDEVTVEARTRRLLYQAEQDRRRAESRFPTREDFLRSCGMRLTVRGTREADVSRVLELMSRTHQLNNAGRVIPREALLAMLADETGTTAVWVADLTDRFGSYGTIGAAIVEMSPSSWTLSYLAISCRVLGRGVERAFLSALLRGAINAGEREALALFRDTGKNRHLRTLYQMMGFRFHRVTEDGATVLRADAGALPLRPAWVAVS